ncbi:MAG: TIGR02678 family protein [Actinobacteria bacterium]|nr:TIGR02678 family protein [Actinomycetota bacterium]
MTLARIAAHLDPASELDDFQAAARALLAHGLVTDRHPHAGALALVRRFEEPLRSEFGRLCHWRLDVGPTCARLLRRPAALSEHRPARTATDSRRPFSSQAYASLCLVLAALESLGDQTAISQLADEVLRLRAGDDALPLDLTVHANRRAFVDAVAWLERRGVLTAIEGDTEGFVASGADTLYDVDRDAAGRLLVSPPSVLSGLATAEDFLGETYPPTTEGAQARVRHRVHRRLLTETALYYDDLPDDERDYARQRRGRIREELERLSGGTLECRAEGQALVGLPSVEAFPAGGAVAQAALLLGSELAVAAATRPAGAAAGAPGAPCAGRVVEATEAHACWRRIVAAYAGRFTSDYRADPDRLRSDALALLGRLGLVGPAPEDGVLVRPALARYRAEVRLADTLDV